MTTILSVVSDLPRKLAEAAALGQGMCLNDLEVIAHNEMMLANTLVKAKRYSEAAIWATAYGKALGHLAEAHDGERASREIKLHNDWVKSQTAALRLAGRRDEKRAPNSETSTIRNCRNARLRGE